MNVNVNVNWNIIHIKMAVECFGLSMDFLFYYLSNVYLDSLQLSGNIIKCLLHTKRQRDAIFAKISHSGH